MNLSVIKTFLSFKIKFIKMKVRKIKLNSFGQYASGLTVSTDFGKMIVDPLDSHVSRQLLKNGNYNPEELERLKELVKITDNALIVGAHIGSIAIPLSKFVKKLVAIEANPRNYDLLKSNVLLNECSNIEILNVAAAEKSSVIKFIVNTENSGGSKREPIIHNDKYR
jgi:hypothetical protein